MLSFECLTFASKGQAGPQRCDLSEGDVSGSECDSMREVIQQSGLEFVNVLNMFEPRTTYDVGQNLPSNP